MLFIYNSSYISDTIKKGNKEHLKAKDIFKLQKKRTSEVLETRLEK